MYYGTPPIVTNGLVLNLDAASPKAAPTRNLLTYTTDLTNAAWSKVRCQITASATTAPDGTNTAFAFNMSTGSGDLKRLAAPNTAPAVAGGLYTFSVFVKQNNFSGSGASAGIQLGNYNGGQTVGSEPVFDVLSNFAPIGSFSLNPASSGSAVSRGTVDVGNGWYRVYTTFNWASSITSFSNFIDIENGTITGSQYQGTGIYIWGPQLETGYLSPYQPVTGTTKPWPSIGSTVTGSMVNNPTWISSNGGNVVFDGVNDYSIINNINLASTNAITISFWFKFTSTAVGLILEHSTNQNNNNAWAISLNEFATGSIALTSHFPPGNTPARYNVSRTSTKAYNDGNWHYVVGIIDRSTTTLANRITIYVDGVRDTLLDGTYTNIETTNFDNHALYGSSRAGSSLFVSCNLVTTQIYNRALTQQEVTQNYNALKSRFI